jgi:hypothetical protein
MSIVSIDSGLFRNFIISLMIFITSSVFAFSQRTVVIDSVYLQDSKLSDTLKTNTPTQKPSVNFYKTDSIFSFHSKKGYVPSLLHNIGAQATAPFHFKSKDWLITGSALGITTLLLTVDDNIDNWAQTQKEKHYLIKKSSPVITEFGNTYGIYLVGIIGSLSAVCKNQKGVQTSLLATQAMITSGVWVQLIKTLTGRERPKGAYLYSQKASGNWYGPFARFDKELASDKSIFAFDAFPSGHTAIAFSIATVFASRYRDVKVIPVLSYSAATLIGTTRLIEHEHWASDVFAGALIGYLCGKQVLKHFNETHSSSLSVISKSKIKSEFTVIQNGNHVGFTLKW